MSGQLGQYLGLAWTIAAWWFLLSVVSAPFFLLIRAARARGKRKFATEPKKRVDSLKSDTTNAYIFDA